MAKTRHESEQGVVEVTTTPEISGCIPIGASDKSGVVDTAQRFLRIVGIAVMAAGVIAAPAYAGDHRGSSHHGGQGHDDDDDDHGGNDPSGLTALVIDADGSALEGLPEAIEGTFEGGKTGHTEDASANNVLQAEDQRDDGRFNVPTNGAPSPLYGAAAVQPADVAL